MPSTVEQARQYLSLAYARRVLGDPAGARQALADAAALRAQAAAARSAR